MSDLNANSAPGPAPEPGPAAPAQTTESAPGAAVAAPAPPPEPPALEPDPFDDPKTDAFPRPYVEKLRREAADRRAAVKRYEEAFGGYEEDEVSIFLDLARDLADPSPQVQQLAAQQLAALSQAILGPGEIQPTGETARDGSITQDISNLDPDQPLTYAQFQAIQKAEQERQAQERYATELRTTAESLGYKRGTPEYNELLARAQFTHGDLKQAHEQRQAEREAAVKEYLQGRQQDVRNSPIAPGAAGVPATQSTRPTTWQDARAAAEARLDAAASMPGR